MIATTPKGLILTIDALASERPRRARHAPPVLHHALLPSRPRSIVHSAVLALVWLTLFSGFFVATEPAPIDALMMGLIVLLPIVGLSRINTDNLAFLFIWLAITACEFVASLHAADVEAAFVHTAVSLYLCLAAFTIASFVARNPAAHVHLLVRGYIASALVGAVLGIIGYFDLAPDAAALFTKHERASGGFKDPNVYAPFLVPAMLFLLHNILTRRFGGVVVAGIGLGVIGLAVLLSFSRGAWVGLTIGCLVYGWLAFVTARTDRQRLKLIAILTIGLLLSIGLIVLTLENDAVAKLFDQRAALGQSYDLGPEGRFGGQIKAVGFILDNPLGLGPLQFGGVYHHEHPHNVYLSMFLNAGWLGGLLYLVVVAFMLTCGLRAILRRTWASPYLLASFAAFCGLVVQGWVVETDHWRHFYIVAGLLYGISVEHVMRAKRLPRLVGPARRDRRPGLILVPQPAIPFSAQSALAQDLARPPRRQSRLRGPARPVPLAWVAPPKPPRRRLRAPRRQARIIGQR